MNLSFVGGRVRTPNLAYERIITEYKHELNVQIAIINLSFVASTQHTYMLYLK